MPGSAVILTESDARALSAMLADYRGKRPYVKARLPPKRSLPGGSCKCLTVHEIRMEGIVTAGTFDLDVEIDDGDSTSTETLTFNWDDTAAEVQTEYETHAKVTSGDINVKGGQFPNQSIYVVFLASGNLARDQTPGLPDASSLTGTNAVVKTGYMTNQDWSA